MSYLIIIVRASLLSLLLLFFLLHPTSSSAGVSSPSPSASPPSRPSDALALLSFKAAADLSGRRPFYDLRHTNQSLPAHCRWAGVSCSAAGRVVRLVIEDAGLNGTFAAGTLDRLDQLRVLSLQSNWLAGPIPDLSKLVNLKTLFLDHNFFDGPFPDSLLSLHRLRVLDLSFNRLAGGIPQALVKLDRLFVLRLDSNRFNGSVPPFNQTSLKIFNVSTNNLSGAIPVTTVLASFDPSAFTANPGLCGEVVKKECSSHFQFFHGNGGGGGGDGGGDGGAAVIAPPSPAAISSVAGQQDGLLLQDSDSHAQKMHRNTVVAIGFLAGAFVVFGVIGVLLVGKKRMKQPQSLSSEKGTSRHVNGVRDINLENYNYEIESTNNDLAAAAALAMSEEKMKKLGKSGCLVFCAGEAQVYTLEQLMRASAELLGRGSVATTYKAVLDNRLIVCVKRLDSTKLGAAGKEAFEQHMDSVGRLRHPNLVPLRAYFQAKEERLLVYDYQPNGSLHSLIHGSRSTRAKPLHWTSCLKIAEDVAQGLAYIHQASRLVHGNIRASNVLLGSDFEACLTDNCLSFLLEPLVGDDDSGYRAPETHSSNGCLTPRSDIYAFGVLLLELLTGKPPLQHPVLITTDLLAWVRSVRVDEGNEDERLMMIIDIAAACIKSTPDSRPTTWQVLKMIQEVKEVEAGDNDSDSTSIS